MNIGIVTTWFERGAAYVSKQYMQLLQPENNVLIYARGGENAQSDQNWNDENVWWAKKPVLGELTEVDLKDFENWIYSKKIDVVFFNEQWHWDVIAYCLKHSIKTGAYIDYYTETTIPFFEAYDFLICNTKRHFEAFKWHPACYYVPWGTDTGLFYPGSNVGHADGKTRFFHSAGMNPHRKGTDLIIEAFKDEYIQKTSQLIIHTQVDLRSFFPQYQNVLERLESVGTLKVIYSTVGAPGLYYMGDVYLYPSRLDGIGLTIAEALSCGLPVVVPDCPPMNEFLDESCGRVVRIERLYARADGYYWPQCMIDISDFQKVIRVFVENQVLVSEMKMAARKYAEQNLCWKKNKEAVLTIFSEAAQPAIAKKKILPETLFRYHNDRRSNFVKVYRKYPLAYQLKKMLTS